MLRRRPGPPGRTPRLAAGFALAGLALSSPLLADVPRMTPGANGGVVFDVEELPVWTDPGDVPVPTWARSVVPSRAESAMYAEPGRLEARRGSAQPGARLPLFATRRAPGCNGRWLNVGPLAWMCSDVAEYSPDEPGTPALGTRPWVADGEDLARPRRPGARPLPPVEPVSASDDGLPYRYYFAGRDGAFGYQNLQTALDDSPEQDLEPGFAVALLDEATAHGERWGRTKKGRWVAMRELVPARANLFHGELLGDRPSVGWIVNDKVSAFTSEKLDKASGVRVRFEKVVIEEEKTVPGRGGPGAPTALRVGDGVWLRARDVSRVELAPPPPEVTGEDERWIDVDLAQQTLVAYLGKTPVFATIVSTGKGPAPDFVTHPGTFRIWVKIFTTKMDNLDKEEADKHYAIEDVPWVQFFDKAIALHGAFWHREFGHVHSHGCVNLAPLDARWLFAFTSPHLPQGWSAVLPTKIERGAVVRIR